MIKMIPTIVQNIQRMMILFFLSILFSCDNYLDVNDTPNRLVEVPTGALLLKGTLLANAQVQQGHLARAAAYYSGGLKGVQLVQQTIYDYNFTPSASNTVWSIAYNGVLAQNKEIRRIAPKLDRLQGIIDVNEAQVMGTLASLFGDIPYTTALPDNPGLDSSDPLFDGQVEVYSAMQNLLDSAIIKLKNSKVKVGDEDIYYNGDKDKWIEAAYTLKARYYLQTKQYDKALNPVDKGISTPANSMNYRPIGAVLGNSNLIYILVEGSRGGDMTGDSVFFRALLDTAKSVKNRNNAKTNETARRQYLYIKGNGAQTKGIDGAATPMKLVSYEENLLIWAECLARSNRLAEALEKLNLLRAYLNSGNAFNRIKSTDSLKYEPYVLADFANGGMENSDNIPQGRALLREIIEERYVSGFTTYMPFNDARRLLKSDSDLRVPFPLNNNKASRNPQRFLYPQSEINANSNIPKPIPDLFEPTPVNK